VNGQQHGVNKLIYLVTVPVTWSKLDLSTQQEYAFCGMLATDMPAAGDSSLFPPPPVPCLPAPDAHAALNKQLGPFMQVRKRSREGREEGNTQHCHAEAVTTHWV
jgi:hypothetical protein